MGICSLWGELTTWIIHLEEVTSTARPTKQKHRNASPQKKPSTFNLQPTTFCPFFFLKKQAKPTKPPKIFWPPTVPKNIVALGDQAKPTIDLPSTGGRDGVGLLLVAQYVLGLGTHRPITQRARDQSCCIVPFLRPKSFFSRFYTSQVVSRTSSINSMDLPAMVVGHPSFLEIWNVCETLPSDQKNQHKARIQSFPPSNIPGSGVWLKRIGVFKGYCNYYIVVQGFKYSSFPPLLQGNDPIWGLQLLSPRSLT